MRLTAFLALLLPTLAAADLSDRVAQWAADPDEGLRFPDAVALHERGSFDWAGGTRVRLEQRLLGLPVLGREIVLSYDLQGRLVRSRGEAIATALLDANPDLPAEDAEALVQELVHRTFGEGTLWPARSELAVWMDGDRARLVWQVRATTARPIGIWRFLVDAHDGTVLRWGTDLHTARGEIFPTNPDSSDLTDVEIPRVASDTLQGTYAFVNSCAEVETGGFGGGQECAEKVRYAEPDSDGNWYFDFDPRGEVDPLSELMMYYHLDLISNWFDEQYGFRHQLPMEGIVNFEYQNAFFGDFDGDGQGEVAFGEWGQADTAYDSDVVYHEFMHSVFGQIVNPGFLGSDSYGLEWAPAGLNEGSADALSLVHNRDPLLGEYAGRAFYGGLGNRPIRDLTELRRCPDDLYGQQHRDGEVWGSLAWAMIDDDRIGPELTADIFYGAILDFPSDVNWAGAGQAYADAAEDLWDQGLVTDEAHDAMIELGERSGVVGCGRVIPLDGEQQSQQLMVHPGFFEDANVPAGQQYSLDAPQDAGRIRLRITDWLTNSEAMKWRLYVRRGEHVEHVQQTVNLGQWTIEVPVPDAYDFAIDGEGAGFELSMLPDGSEIEGDAEVSLGLLPALEPGSTYFFAITSRQDGNIQGYANAEITVEGDVWINPDWQEPGTGDDDDSGAGCEGCQASVSGFSAGWLALLPLALRRRR